MRNLIANTREGAKGGRQGARENHFFRAPCPVPHAPLIVFGTLCFLALAVTGCSTNYNGERLFWKAEQLYTPIVKNRDNATPEQFARAIEAFEFVRAKAPGTMWAPRADASIGALYAIQKQYAKAREAYALVLQNYNEYKDLCLGSRYAIGKTYEAEQNWDAAITVYQDIAEYHPWSVAGLEVPLYIAQISGQHQTPDQGKAAYGRAVRIYTQLLVDAPTPALATKVKSYLALTYQRLGQWDDAIKTLEELANTPGANRPLALLTIGVIDQVKLKNIDKAVEAYSTLVKEFPDQPIGKAAKARLERLGLPGVERMQQPGATPAQIDASAVPTRALIPVTTPH